MMNKINKINKQKKSKKINKILINKIDNYPLNKFIK